MSLPAVVLVDDASGLRLAGLPVLDRLLVALYRAGCGPVTLVAHDALPALNRARKTGLVWSVSPEPPPTEGPVLVAAGSVLASPDDIGAVLAVRGRLHDREGHPLPLGVAPSPVGVDPEAALVDVPPVVAGGCAARVRDAGDARRAEEALWSSLEGSADGWVDRWFNRPIARPLARWLVGTPVTPNHITAASLGVGLVAAWLFARGTAWSTIGGATIFQLSALIDCMDGDVARAALRESTFGQWFDILADQVVHVAVFAGIAIGVERAGSGTPAMLLGGVAVLGVIIASGVVLSGSLRGDSPDDSLLSRLVHASTNRDFSVVLLVLAAAGWMEAFLWAAAVGAHVFWVAALAAHRLDRRAEVVGRSVPHRAPDEG